MIESLHNSAYRWLMLAGIAFSATWWWRRRREPRLALIYIAALLGAFLGAKIAYVTAEGWLHFGQPDQWIQLATGKSITGALLGGYLAVEFAKSKLHYHAATGDAFAVIVPAAIVMGRLGCWFQGCCLGKACASAWFTVDDADGVARWPAVPAEILFNLAAAGLFWEFRRKNLLRGQHFHIYLMAYGLFRFVHEFLRATPAVAGPLSGYQFWAAAILVFGCVRFRQRCRPTVGGINLDGEK